MPCISDNVLVTLKKHVTVIYRSLRDVAPPARPMRCACDVSSSSDSATTSKSTEPAAPAASEPPAAPRGNIGLAIGGVVLGVCLAVLSRCFLASISGCLAPPDSDLVRNQKNETHKLRAHTTTKWLLSDVVHYSMLVGV